MRMRVDVEGLVAAVARVEFSGVDMNMGQIEVPLQPDGSDTVVTETMLPACIRRQMTWRAVVTLDGSASLHRATFVFDVNRH